RAILRRHRTTTAQRERREAERTDYVHPGQAQTEDAPRLNLLTRDLSPSRIRLLSTRSLLGQKLRLTLPAARKAAGPRLVVRDVRSESDATIPTRTPYRRRIGSVRLAWLARAVDLVQDGAGRGWVIGRGRLVGALDAAVERFGDQAVSFAAALVFLQAQRGDV